MVKKIVLKKLHNQEKERRQECFVRLICIRRRLCIGCVDGTVNVNVIVKRCCSFTALQKTCGDSWENESNLQGFHRRISRKGDEKKNQYRGLGLKVWVQRVAGVLCNNRAEVPPWDMRCSTNAYRGQRSPRVWGDRCVPGLILNHNT